MHRSCQLVESWKPMRAVVLCTLTAIALCLAVVAGDDVTPLDGRGGGLVAFYSERDGDSEILIMNADGSGIRQLTENDCADDAPALSPDGRYLAFVSERTGNAEIFVLDLTDLSVRQLTDTPGMETHPDWSPDGTMIAFTRYSPGSWSDGDLFLMSANGDGERQLTSHPGDDMRPAWFSNGERLLFSSKRDGNYEIYEIAVDGSGLRRITSTALHELFPRLSPNGTQIVYTLGDFVRRRFAVHVMNLDGSDDRALTEGSHVSGEDPVWAEDGSRIVFQSDRTGNFEIFIMNADGSEQVNLTNLPSGEFWPSWASSDPGGFAVPLGTEPAINGTIDDEEWADAAEVALEENSRLYLKHAEGFLYLAVRATTMGVPSPMIVRGEDVVVLHASAALGTAIYRLEAESWVQSQAFDWQCRDRGFGAAAVANREAFLEQEGWLGTIGYLGAPTEFELKIRVDEESLQMLFLFMEATQPLRMLSWPGTSTEAAQYLTLITGPIPTEIEIDFGQWATLWFESP